MGQSNGRTGRIVCFVLSVLLLVVAAVLLTDAAQVDTEPQATKLIVLAQVLATGSVTFMIGALVWTMAARNRPEHAGSAHVGSGQGGAGQGGAGQGGAGRSGPGYGGSGHVQSAHAAPQAAWQQPEHPGAGHPPAGYGGGPAQEAWVPPPAPPPHDPHTPHGGGAPHE